MYNYKFEFISGEDGGTNFYTNERKFTDEEFRTIVLVCYRDIFVREGSDREIDIDYIGFYDLITPELNKWGFKTLDLTAKVCISSSWGMFEKDLKELIGKG